MTSNDNDSDDIRNGNSDSDQGAVTVAADLGKTGHEDGDLVAADDAGEARRYIEQVMAEIDEEVRRRRANGDLPVRVERELDELFLEFSPVAGRGGALIDALQLVDAAAFIDPVVPIESQKSGGAVLKKGVRTLSLWYMGWITTQVSKFTSSTARALHLIDDRLTQIQRDLDARWVPPAEVIDVPGSHHAGAWWVGPATAALGDAPGRVLHAACGDGWLVRHLESSGVDAYGIDPRPDLVTRAEFDGTDLRQESPFEHFRSVESAALGGVVLSGVVDGLSVGERTQLLASIADGLSPGATLVAHSLSPTGWVADDAPVAADLAPGRPLRPRSWEQLLAPQGYSVTVEPGPDGSDYLVVAVLSGGTTRRR